MECCLQRRRVPEQSTPSARAWSALPRPIAGSRCLACPTSRTSCVAACWRRCSYVMVLLVARCGGLVHRRAVKEGQPERARDRQPSLVVLSCRPTSLHTTLRPNNLEPCSLVLLSLICTALVQHSLISAKHVLHSEPLLSVTRVDASRQLPHTIHNHAAQP
jgi:hypothetical protein